MIGVVASIKLIHFFPCMYIFFHKSLHQTKKSLQRYIVYVVSTQYIITFEVTMHKHATCIRHSYYTEWTNQTSSGTPGTILLFSPISKARLCLGPIRDFPYVVRGFR